MRLIDISNFDFSSIVFSSPYYNENNSTINIRIGVRQNDNNDVEDLIFSTPRNLVTYGVQEIIDKNTSTLLGYQLPLVFNASSQQDDSEKQFIEFIEKISEIFHDYATQEIQHNNKEKDAEIPPFLSPLVLKSQKDNDEEKRVIFYVKLLTNYTRNRFLCVFIDEESNREVDPLHYLNKKHLATIAIKAESIIIGKKISIRFKICEAIMKPFPYRPKKYQSILRPSVQVQLKNGKNEKKKEKSERNKIPNKKSNEHNNNTQNQFQVIKKYK